MADRVKGRVNRVTIRGSVESVRIRTSVHATGLAQGGRRDVEGGAGGMRHCEKARPNRKDKKQRGIDAPLPAKNGIQPDRVVVNLQE